MKQPVTIPTLLGIILLVAGVVAGVFALQQGQVWFLRASPEEQPKEVRITNITDSSFSVSWITDTSVRGFIQSGLASDSLSTVSTDDRDTLASSQGEFRTHHVTVSGLTPGSEYHFKIGSGARLYDNQGKPFTLTTAPLATGSGDPTLISGLVSSSSGADASGTLVYVSFPGLTPQSTVIRSGNAYSLSLSRSRSSDLASYFSSFPEGSVLELFLDSATSQATASVHVSNRDAIPSISLPGDYDFSSMLSRDSSGQITLPEGTTSLVASSSAKPVSSSQFSFTDLPPAQESDEITLISPQVLESLSVTNPQIFGVAAPGKTLTLTLSPNSQSYQAKSNTKGSWSWTPTTPLVSGEHTLTISYVDKAGNLQKLVRKFSVASTASLSSPSLGGIQSSSALAFTASPSATLAPSATSSPGPSSAPSPTATRTPTPQPTARASMPSTDSEVPVSGNWEITLIVILSGAALVTFGSILHAARSGSQS